MKSYLERNGWTGGQYSLFRFSFGVYLFVHFLQLVGWGTEMFSNQGMLPTGSASPLLYLFPNMFALCDTPAFVTGVLSLACLLAAALAVGFHDRSAAVGLWYIWACLLGRMPFINNPGVPYVGLLLLAHACLPPGAFGSLAARGKTDPGSTWRMPQQIFAVVWFLMAAGYTYSGYTKLVSPSWVDGTAVKMVLSNPLARPGFVRDIMLALPAWMLHLATWGALALELTYLPLSFARVARPVIWTLMLAMHLGLVVLIDFADLSLGMVMLHLFTFDPAWVKGRTATGRNLPEMVFYDGSCGLCHGAIRFLLSEDSSANFAYAALDSGTFREKIPLDKQASLPDSMVVLTADNQIILRSQAWQYILSRLGGAWSVAAGLMALLPVQLLDFAYDCVAGVRKQLFAKPKEACPLMPRELRARFRY